MTHFETLLSSLLVLGTFVLGSLSCGPTLSATSKTEAIKYLNSLKKQNRSQLIKVNESIQERLQKATQYQSLQTSILNPPNAYQNAKTKNNENFLDQMIAKRQELLLRQSFLDQLSFCFDTHYKGKKIKKFLYKQLVKMAEIEAFSQVPSSQKIWKFLSYLAVAIKEYPEQNEDILAFVEGYMKFSNISNPLRPDQYFSSRHYSNGTTTKAAAPVHKEELGGLIEDKLNQLEHRPSNIIIKESIAPTTKNIESNIESNITPTKVGTPEVNTTQIDIPFGEPKEVIEDGLTTPSNTDSTYTDSTLGLHKNIENSVVKKASPRDPASLPSRFKPTSIWAQ